MSRIGKMPIQVPKGVTVSQSDGIITVKGPKGTLSRQLHTDIDVKQEGDTLLCIRHTNQKEHRALHGLTRALLANMVTGVVSGYEKRMEVEGVGYRAEVQGVNLQLQVGLSHPVVVVPLEGISFEVGQNTSNRMPFIMIRGIDKESVGQQCAYIRRIRPPEPYKGKGIRFFGETIRRKAGKAGKTGAKK